MSDINESSREEKSGPTQVPVANSKQSLHTIKFYIWWGMLSFLAVYALMAYTAGIAPDHGPKDIEGPLIILRNLFMAGGAFTFLLAYIVGYFIKGQEIIKLVVQLLLLETCGLCGFLFTMFSWHIEYTLFFGGVAAVGMLTVYPRRKSTT